MENVVGGGAFALIFFMLSAMLGIGGMLRWVVLVIGILMGIIITFDVGGLALYDRALWWLRGQMRRRVAGERISPEMLAGTGDSGQRERAMRLGGPIRIVRTSRGGTRSTRVTIDRRRIGGGS
jgi:hypothetical protein